MKVLFRQSKTPGSQTCLSRLQRFVHRDVIWDFSTGNCPKLSRSQNSHMVHLPRPAFANPWFTSGTRFVMLPIRLFPVSSECPLNATKARSSAATMWTSSKRTNAGNHISTNLSHGKAIVTERYSNYSSEAHLFREITAFTARNPNLEHTSVVHDS